MTSSVHRFLSILLAVVFLLDPVQASQSKTTHLSASNAIFQREALVLRLTSFFPENDAAALATYHAMDAMETDLEILSDGSARLREGFFMAFSRKNREKSRGRVQPLPGSSGPSVTPP